jgi:hypothetical protein
MHKQRIRVARYAIANQTAFDRGTTVYVLNNARFTEAGDPLRVADRGVLGRRYVLPERVAGALERIFDEPVGAVKVVEYSRYARIHLGMAATTRPNRILLAISGAEFVANPEVLLHEYFHVLRQWGTGQMTHWRYLVESGRRGYWENRFEREAREFSAGEVERYCRYLSRGI